MTPDESARRMRAMQGWSLMNQGAFIEALGLEEPSARNLFRTSGATRASDDVLRRAAAISGMPERFALDGLDAMKAAEPPSAHVEDVLSELRAGMAHLLATTARHTRELQELRAVDRSARPGGGGQR
ncbi:hypothetical protein [Paraconexibacter algicola]|uniref:Uncharacterized protein n=1 Tax=Paraconexibacter algicola TaxID=2133960 RepID=A0A2T4UE23_9ACTN|nr:hypothetical protein [Paraconexibacter algicola]PTL55764.1 hypothetical protein C7Y72_19235 [Paraconexibacter algicola]